MHVSGAMVTNQAYYEDTNKKIARLTHRKLNLTKHHFYIL